jgi:hypothetical protein
MVRFSREGMDRLFPVEVATVISWTLFKPTQTNTSTIMNAYSVSRVTLLLFFSGTGLTFAADPWNWLSPQVSPTQNYLSAIAYGNGQFVAVGDKGTIVTSADGANWTQRKSGTEKWLLHIAYGNGQFVACNINTLVTSPDGVNWTLHQCCGGVGLGYGNGLFVISNEDFTYVSGNPADGRLPATDPSSHFSASAIGYGNGHFVALDGRTSTDGLKWTSPALNGRLHSIAYGKGQFVIVGEAGAIVTSTDGVNWIQRQSSTITSETYLLGVAYGNGQFVAVGIGPSTNTAVITSADGVNWIQRQSSAVTPDMYLTSVAYGNGRFVVVGYHGVILHSGSIVSLALTPDISPGLLKLSLEGPTRQAYTIQSSTDLISWRNLTNITTTQPTRVILDALPTASDPLFYRAYSQ